MVLYYFYFTPRCDDDVFLPKANQMDCLRKGDGNGRGSLESTSKGLNLNQ